MWAFIKSNWIYFVAIATVLAYLFDKVYKYLSEKKQKKQAYNRVFSSIIKLYFSYLKHKQIYSEKPPHNFPDEVFVIIAKHLNSFNYDLVEFKNEVYRETDIVPEVTLQSYLLIDIIDRMFAIDRIKIANDPNLDQPNKTEELAIKRAQFYALDDILGEFFKDIIHDVKKYSSVNNSLVKRLLFFNTDEYVKEALEAQGKVMRRYYESLYRQGLLPEGVYKTFLENMVI